jgi:hypothetical protein
MYKLFIKLIKNYKGKKYEFKDFREEVLSAFETGVSKNEAERRQIKRRIIDIVQDKMEEYIKEHNLEFYGAKR